MMPFIIASELKSKSPKRGSKGFDRGLAAGEAIRCDTLIAKLKLNAEDNLALAA